jgi:hypothetical protein
MAEYIESLQRLAEQFGRLQGVGRKSAMRMAFSVIEMDEESAAAFASAIMDAKQNIHECPICGNLTDGALCSVCEDDARDRSVICVVEDVKENPNERYPYVIFFPSLYSVPSYNCKLLLRLKPGVDAEEFVKNAQPTLTDEFRAGIFVLNYLDTYRHHYDQQLKRDNNTLISQMTSVPLVLFCINVVLGTLGTFWLQLRKRREDIGIMRAFGASRRRIFAMLLAEGAVLTALATFVGCFIWFQFAASNDLLSDGNIYGGSGRETDWVTQFWPHFLIISFIVYMLILLVVSIAVSLPAWNVCRQKVVEALRSE